MPHAEADPSAPRSHPYPGGIANDPPFRPAGRHRADGLAGPPRRYLGMVALLAGAASLPMIAAVAAGPGTLGGTALGEISPFLAPPSGGPVIVPLPPASGLGDPVVVPGGAMLPVVPLPAILLTTGGSAVGTVRVTTGTAAAPRDAGTGRVAAPLPAPIPDQGEVASPSPTPEPDPPVKGKAGRGGQGPRDAPAGGTSGCRQGPKADLDRGGDAVLPSQVALVPPGPPANLPIPV